MGTFKQEETDAMICRLILSCFKNKPEWVTHDDIVIAILNDAEGKQTIMLALQGSTNGWRPSQWASNMIAWFSQRITEDTSDYSLAFERTQIKGKYAYKPKSGSW